MKSGAGSSWMVAVLSSTAAARKSARARRKRGRSWGTGHSVSSGWQHHLRGSSLSLALQSCHSHIPPLAGREQSWDRLLSRKAGVRVLHLLPPFQSHCALSPAAPVLARLCLLLSWGQNPSLCPWEPVPLTWMWQHRLRQEVTARTDPLPRRLEEMRLTVNVLAERSCWCPSTVASH